MLAQAVALTRINCTTRKQATLAVQYVRGFIEKPSYGPYRQPKWRDIVPGSMDEAAFNYLCAESPKSK
jgi:hypothetical protein